jgi:Concanavalin A-like lectin/glucanases superfamily
LPGSSLIARWSFAALALVAGGCSTRTLLVVDPVSCPDGGGGPGCAAGLLDGLVGFWRLNDPPGSATARDSSPWGNDGTVDGIDPSMAWMAVGPEGGSLSPQGKGYVSVPDSTSIDSITDQVTVAGWIYLDGAINQYATLISRQQGNGFGQDYHLSLTSTQNPGLYITTTTGGQLDIVAREMVPQQTWVHLAGTYDGAATRLYLNGAEVNSGVLGGPFASETNAVVVGGNGNGTDFAVSEQIPGQLDEVVLYRRALSADEIARIEAGALRSGAM